MRAVEYIALCALAASASATAVAQDPALQPFTATFAVEWRGITAGYSTLKLTRPGPETYVYESTNTARGIFKLAFPDAITQISTLRIIDGEVRPITYRADDGSRDTSRDVALEFDWEGGRVVGVAEDEPVDKPLEPGTQDPLSVQIALIRELRAGRSPNGFRLMDKDEIKQYHYARTGTETLDTPLGPLETVVYDSQRDGSSRVTRMWLAPSLDYLPVRAQQTRDGKVQFAMQLRSLERGDPPVAAQR